MYEDKQNEYFKNVRKDLLDLIPQDNRNGTILEIGAGTGNTLIYAKKNGYAKNIVGIELCKIENSYQNNKEFDDFIIGNIEEIKLSFADKQFDVIICGDVLEHLIDPYSVVDKLKKYLKDDGVFIASIPNIRYYTIIKEIFINGTFKYTNAGILDKTHLRFFCKKDILELFENSSYEIIQLEGNSFFTNLRPKLTLFNNLTFRIFEDFLIEQYFVVAKKNG